jgi:hypothetical protein
LESRLVAALDVHGSPEYALTWKHWDMPSGPPICALRASGRRTSGSACSGWPTPDAQAMNVGADLPTHMARMDRLKATHKNGNGAGLTLGIVSQLAGWVTPTSNDARQTEAMRQTPTRNLSGLVVRTIGRTPSGSSASTAKRGALNPDFVRWLMGYPPAHLDSAPTATRSSRRSRPSFSARSAP